MVDGVEVVTAALRGQGNRLGDAGSAYLRSAQHQPVNWMEWGEPAFERAAAEDKAILLDIGAVWCHWCHVMDRESYEDPATAAVINENFIAVKVDRDERPDVDTRYQAAVAAISGQGGWPLTAFLTPDGRPFFGGTYFPPQDGHGRPSFRRVLLTMAEAFIERRDEVEESGSSALAAIEQNEAFSGMRKNPGAELVGKLVASALGQFDPRNGGFGSQPKFPHTGAIDLLLDYAGRNQGPTGEQARMAALVTLDKMSKGGIYDHLAGGFHRYSVDERWVVPHFEKMAYDNSALLQNYLHAFQASADPEPARVARDTMRWMDEWLSDREQGGFYGSQDADYSLEDDGDFFTWTKDEAAAALTADEMLVAGPFYDIGEIGDMHHNPAKNVLHVTRTLTEVARAAGLSSGRAIDLLRAAKQKLYQARKTRPAPFIDKTMYVGWNGMCISAYLLAGRVLGEAGPIAFALKTLDRVIDSAWTEEKGLERVIAYGTGGRAGARIAGVLEDYVLLGTAALDAWEATGAMSYFAAAEGLMRAALDRFYDLEGKAFFDTEGEAGQPRRGALTVRRKPLQDSPTPSGNAVAASLLLRLEALTGSEEYRARAQQTLECFADVVEHFGLYAAGYGLALTRLVNPPVQVCVVGDEEEARRLETVALSGFAVNRTVVRLRREQLQTLPPALAQTLPFLPNIALHGDESFAVVCSGNTCQMPVRSTEELAAQLAGMERPR